jgi:hypothetical protein
MGSFVWASTGCGSGSQAGTGSTTGSSGAMTVGSGSAGATGVSATTGSGGAAGTADTTGAATGASATAGAIGASGAAGTTGSSAMAGTSEDGGADAAPPNDASTSSLTAPTGKNVLMVVGDGNGTVAKGMGPGDQFLKNRLQTLLGEHVTMMADTTAKPMLLQAANAADLVIMCESLLSGNVLATLKPSTTPILSYEAFLQDDFGMVDTSGKVSPPTAAGGCDPGMPPACTYGTLVVDHMDIVNPTHPLAAGLPTGTVKLYTTPGDPARDPGGLEVNWGKVGTGAEVIATLTGFPTAATFYVYRKGATLFDGTKAAAMRMQLWFEDDNTTGTLNLSTPDGFKLFDNAVTYALATP